MIVWMKTDSTHKNLRDETHLWIFSTQPLFFHIISFYICGLWQIRFFIRQMFLSYQPERKIIPHAEPSKMQTNVIQTTSLPKALFLLWLCGRLPLKIPSIEQSRPNGWASRPSISILVRFMIRPTKSASAGFEVWLLVDPLIGLAVGIDSTSTSPSNALLTKLRDSWEEGKKNHCYVEKAQ